MATASVTYTFANLTNADATKVNQNFTDLATFLNTEALQRDGSIAVTGQLAIPQATASTAPVRKDQLDARIQIVTSGTRPGSPTDGMLIYETDTDRFLRRSSGAWKYLSPITGTQTVNFVASQTATATITFGVTFSTVPKVLVYSGTAGGGFPFVWAVQSITTTQCQVSGWWTLGSGTQSPSVTWVAFEG